MKINLLDIMESLNSDNMEDAATALHEWFVEQGKLVHARMNGQLDEADLPSPVAQSDDADDADGTFGTDADADADTDVEGDDETLDSDDTTPTTTWDIGLDTIDDDSFEVSDMIGDSVQNGEKAGTAKIDWTRTGFEAEIKWVVVESPTVDSADVESKVCIAHPTADFNKACFWGVLTETNMDTDEEFYAVWVAFNANMREDEAFYEKQLTHHVDNMAIVARIREINGVSPTANMESMVSEDEGPEYDLYHDVAAWNKIVVGAEHWFETMMPQEILGEPVVLDKKGAAELQFNLDRISKLLDKNNIKQAVWYMKALDPSRFVSGNLSIDADIKLDQEFWNYIENLTSKYHVTFANFAHYSDSVGTTTGGSGDWHGASAAFIGDKDYRDAQDKNWADGHRINKKKSVFGETETYDDLVAELNEAFEGLETVSDKLQNVEGAQVGEQGKVPVNKKSTLPSKKGDKRVGGAAVEIKGKGHNGHTLEKAPKVTDVKVKGNVQNSKDDPKKVAAPKGALLNKMDGSVNTQSPISGKGAKGLKK